MTKRIKAADLPVSEKHPDWVQWLERNGIQYGDIKIEGLHFDWSNRQLAWREGQEDGSVLPHRKTVDSTPPWVTR